MLLQPLLANRAFRSPLNSTRFGKPYSLNPSLVRSSRPLVSQVPLKAQYVAAFPINKFANVPTLIATAKSSPIGLFRLYYTSLPILRKSTTALRRERAEAQPKPAPVMQSGVLFEKNSRTFFMVLTGVAMFQAIFFLGAAEFYWQYDVSLVDGINAGADFISRMTWPAFFTLVGSFLPITRHFFGSRYVHKLELLPNSTVNVYTYDFLARPKVFANVPIDAFRPNGFNDKGDYYKVKLRGYRWFFIMDKTGSISDPNAFTDVVHGRRPTTRY